MSHFANDRQARQNLQTRQVWRQALGNTDELVVEFVYCNADGELTRRIVSPIRFLDGERLLGLCLSREEPRQFNISRCRDMQLRPAAAYLMPVPLQVVPWQLVAEQSSDYAVSRSAADSAFSSRSAS